MSEINQINELLTDELYYLRMSLGIDIGFLKFSDLSCEVKNKVLLLYLEYMDMDIPEILYDVESSMMLSLKALILKPTTENKVNFSNEMLQVLLETYNDKLQLILDSNVEQSIGSIEYEILSYKNIHWSKQDRI